MNRVLLPICLVFFASAQQPHDALRSWKKFATPDTSSIHNNRAEARSRHQESGTSNNNIVDTSRWVGAEYQPSQSSNEDWLYHYQDYRSSIIREFSQIKRVMNFTALRIFLHSSIYDKLGKDQYLNNLNDFLTIAKNSNMGIGFVFFDDCWNHAGLDLEKPCQPVKGIHNGCWMASPQDVDRSSVDRFQSYVTDTIVAFQHDSRVIWWEIFNEPQNSNPFSIALRKQAYLWAKTVSPSQPILSCWDENEGTDLVDHHQYTQPWEAEKNGVFMNSTGRMQGGLVTEAGARWYQGESSDSGSPLTVIDWLTKLKTNKQAAFVPGVMIDWEVMVSNSNTRWHWGTAAQSPEPTIPWHQHIFPDGTPVSYTEAGAIRRYITGRDEFLFFEDFLTQNNPQSGEVYLNVPASGYRPSVSVADGLIEFTFWQTAPPPPGSCVGNNTDYVGSDVDLVQYSGSTDQEKDASCCQSCQSNDRCEYWVRATDSTNCWLKNGFQGYSPNPARRGNFRPSQAKTSFFESTNNTISDASGFLDLSFSNWNVRIDFATQALLLLKSNVTVSRTDLRSLDCGITTSGWNMFRVLKQQNQLAVWLNPMHDEVFPNGISLPGGPVKPIQAMPPRLNYTDSTGFGPAAPLTLAFVGRIDYFSVLPPVLYGENFSL